MSLINSNKKNAVFYSMIVLGTIMIALGLMPAPNIVPPPIVTGIGFWVLAWGMK
ncbi:MAG: hypothetical protein V7741_01285 [Hyphomonas sp.]|uniref:hypothetical protein n=1 Tax=Hyphomonas sp. BRH_c22 TaxID=1629710 RepID=UPI000AACFBFF|nr:hypothetical protein [Hyphomonas sp. BRH_c22]